MLPLLAHENMPALDPELGLLCNRYCKHASCYGQACLHLDATLVPCLSTITNLSDVSQRVAPSLRIQSMLQRTETVSDDLKRGF